MINLPTKYKDIVNKAIRIDNRLYKLRVENNTQLALRY